jgi:hypothetical protein
MWSKILLAAIAISAASCNNSTSSNTITVTDTLSDGSIVERKTQNNTDAGSENYWEKLVMVEIKDKHGIVAAIMPFPSNWNIGSVITGPHGIRVTNYPLQLFMINYNPMLQQAYSQTQQRAMPGIEQLIQEDFVPAAQQRGMQLEKFYEIPEVTKMDKWYSDQLFKAMPSQIEIAAIGIDWKKPDGGSYFQIVHLNVSTSNAGQNWSYYVSGLEAEPEHFEKAKNQYVFALANARYNLEPIARYNREEAQRCNQSWAAHNARMAQNQANFEAQQRAFVNRSNAVNDAIMSGWRERNASGDRMQEATIDGIYERSNVQNTETGQMYKVQAGANQYWMNRDGEYISTRLNDYDPNLDDNMYHQKWQQLKEVKKN